MWQSKAYYISQENQNHALDNLVSTNGSDRLLKALSAKRSLSTIFCIISYERQLHTTAHSEWDTIFFSKCEVQLAGEAPITTASVTYSNLKNETSGIWLKTNAIKPATLTVWVQFNTSRFFPMDVLPVFEQHMTWNERLANDSLGSGAQEDVWHKEIRGSSIYYRLSNSAQQSSAVWGLWA